MKFLPWVFLLFPCICPAVDAIITDDISVSTRPNPSPARGNQGRLPLSDSDTVYLKFDLDAVLPDGVTSARIEKASLTVWVESVTKAGNVYLKPVLEDWTERPGVRPGGNFEPIHKNPPALGVSIANGAADRAQQFLTFDVTSQVKKWIDGDANHGVAMMGLQLLAPAIYPGGGPTYPFKGTLSSKESKLGGHPPRLQIVLSGN